MNPHRGMDEEEPLNAYQRLVVQNAARHKQLAEVFVGKHREGEWPAVMFTREKEHARAQAHALSVALGMVVEVVTSDMPKGRRAELAARMRERDAGVPVVVATDVWATGIDIPSLRAEYNLGGGSAPIGMRQRAGRPLRKCGGKQCKIYDVADRTAEGAFEEHNAKRLEHYERAGFKVSDRALMAQLLDGGPGSKRGRPPLEGPPARSPGVLDLLLDPTSLLIAAVILVLMFTDVCH